MKVISQTVFPVWMTCHQPWVLFSNRIETLFNSLVYNLLKTIEELITFLSIAIVHFNVVTIKILNDANFFIEGNIKFEGEDKNEIMIKSDGLGSLI